MARPFDYIRMTPREFREELERVGLTQNTFSKLTGVPNRRVGQFMSGIGEKGNEMDIPQWVPTFLMLVRDPATMQRAWDAAKARIIEGQPPMPPHASQERLGVPVVGHISEGGVVRPGKPRGRA